MSDFSKVVAEVKTNVKYKCPHCGKVNPDILPIVIGDSSDSQMIGFVPDCCKKIITIQAISKSSGIIEQPAPPQIPC